MKKLTGIGYATEQGVADLQGKDVELHTGIYVPKMSAADLKEAIRLAKANGAKGVSFFDGPGITDKQWQVITEFTKEAK